MSLVINVNVCRVCMQPGEGNSLRDNKELQKKFTEITRLKIDSVDGMPFTICHKCEMKLEVADRFVRMARKSECKLVEFLEKVSSDFANVRVEDDPYLEDYEEPNDVLDEGASERLISSSMDETQKIVEEIPTNGTEVGPTERVHIIENLCLRGELIEARTENGQEEVADTMILDYEPNEFHASAADETNLNDTLLNYNNEEDSTNDMEDDIIVSGNIDGPVMTNENSDENGHLLMDMFEFAAVNGNADEQDNAMSPQQQDVYPPTDTTFEYALHDVGAEHVAARRTATRKTRSLSQSFYCVKCQRDFSTRTNLNRHMLTHGGLRPFACDICGKSFTQNATLKQHMYTHTGEKPFVCNVCHRGFTQCKTLVIHMRVHSGNKPFLCDICGMEFRQKHALKAHMLKQHLQVQGDESGAPVAHICIVCNEMLLDNESLQVHMNSHVNNHRSSSSLMGYEEEPLLGDGSGAVELEDLPSAVKESSVHIIDVKGTSAAEPSRAMKFQCRKCFKCFNLQMSLVRHLKMHEDQDQALSSSSSVCSNLPVEVLYGNNTQSGEE